MKCIYFHFIPATTAITTSTAMYLKLCSSQQLAKRVTSPDPDTRYGIFNIIPLILPTWLLFQLSFIWNRNKAIFNDFLSTLCITFYTVCGSAFIFRRIQRIVCAADSLSTYFAQAFDSSITCHYHIKPSHHRSLSPHATLLHLPSLYLTIYYQQWE